MGRAVKHLLIDAGNTFCKLVLYNEIDDTIGTISTFSYNNIEQELNDYFKTLEIKSLIVSNVNNLNLDKIFAKLAKKIWGLEPKNIKADSCHSKLKSRYTTIKTLGCDRWAAMLGILYQYDTNFCVVDCGTAITIDIVVDSCHQGGLIAPGLNTSFNSLNQDTANLPIINDNQLSQKLDIVATSTADCIAAGVLYQAVALIEKSVKNSRKNYDKEMLVFITGGNAQLISKLSELQYTVKQNLVLDGLKMAVKYNLFGVE